MGKANRVLKKRRRKMKSREISVSKWKRKHVGDNCYVCNVKRPNYGTLLSFFQVRKYKLLFLFNKSITLKFSISPFSSLFKLLVLSLPLVFIMVGCFQQDAQIDFKENRGKPDNIITLLLQKKEHTKNDYDRCKPNWKKNDEIQ